MPEPSYDIAVIGAGPIGIASARECAENGLRVALIDRGALLAAMYAYPRHMRFFSTAERIAICDLPFPSVDPRPSRDDALAYYRLVARHPDIHWHLYRPVLGIDGSKGHFQVRTSRETIAAERVILATGFYQRPNILGIPGEDLPQVSHYFDDGHAYCGQRLLIVGGANSAVIAALECWRAGAEVTLVHRGSTLDHGVKYWLKPDFDNRVSEGSIRAFFNAQVTAIDENHLHAARSDGGELGLEHDFVLLLTGYRADSDWLRSLGLELDGCGVPLHRESDLQSSSRAGIHLAGCVLCGENTSSLFIENGRQHARVIARALQTTR